MRRPAPTRTTSGSMPMPRRPERLAVLVALAAAGVAAIVVSSGGGQSESSVSPAAFTWRGLVGDVRPAVPIGQREVVVLKTPALREHVANGGFATGTPERPWTAH